MRSSSWNDEGPVQGTPRRGSWIKWLVIGVLVVFGLPALIGGAFAALAVSHHAKVWPAVQAVHARLQTDAGARDLFRKNPSLAGAYGGEEAFLDTVRAWRGKVGALPAQEPREGAGYDLSLEPEGAGVQVQGAGGAWMQVDIVGGPLAGPEEGEGVVRLFFAEDEKGLHAADAGARERRNARARADFRRIFEACADDARALALYRREPGLQDSYRSEGAFLEHLKSLRPAIAALLAAPEGKEGSFHQERKESPLGLTVVITLTPDQGKDQGQALSATWHNDRLTRLEGQAPILIR